MGRGSLFHHLLIPCPPQLFRAPPRCCFLLILSFESTYALSPLSEPCILWSSVSSQFIKRGTPLLLRHESVASPRNEAPLKPGVTWLSQADAFCLADTTVHIYSGVHENWCSWGALRNAQKPGSQATILNYSLVTHTEVS